MSSPDSHYQVTIVKYGTRSTVKSDVYLNYPLYREPDAPIEMDYFFWILRGADRTIVVDTGFSPAGGAVRNRTSLADVAEHRVMFHHSVQDEEIDYLHHVAREDRLVLFDDVFDVAPGVTVTKVGGHTPGQSVVRVETSEGVALLASDAIHYYEEYERDMLFMSVANLVDMYEGFDRIRALVENGDVTHLVSGHDPDTLNRFTPATGPFSHLAATIGVVPDVKEGS